MTCASGGMCVPASLRHCVGSFAFAPSWVVAPMDRMVDATTAASEDEVAITPDRAMIPLAGADATNASPFPF